MWPPMWTRIAARRLVRARPCARSPRTTCRGPRGCSRRTRPRRRRRSPPAGVAMKVFEGQSTVSPRTPANSSAASAPPAQLDIPTLGRPFHSAQRCSKASSFAPSDHCSESSTSVQRSKSRPRSRWSNPIANCVASDRVVSRAPKAAGKASSETRLGYPQRAGSIVLVSGLEDRADRPRAGQQDGAADGDRHEGDQHHTAERGRAPGLVEDQRRQERPGPGPGPRTSPARRGSPGGSAGRSSR